jgi:hypothetical protein
MAGLYHTSSDIKWSNIRAAERREEADWLSGAPQRKLDLARREREEYFRVQDGKEKAKKLADKISRTENFQAVCVDLSSAKMKHFFAGDLCMENELEVFTEKMIKNLESEIRCLFDYIVSTIFSRELFFLACLCFYLVKVLLCFLNGPEIVCIIIIAGSMSKQKSVMDY